MPEDSKNTILVTGQSGIFIKKHIRKLIGQLIEDECPVKNDPIIVEDAMKKKEGKEFVKILAYPPRVQEELWKNTFNKEVIPQISSKDNEGKFLFLTFHASYYHQKKTEFLCPVDFDELGKIVDKVKLLIVLVDDCYDIYLRLLEEKQMFAYVNELDELKALYESITNLINILTWREIEIAFSRKIHQYLKIPMYIIATKHPAFMVARLVIQPRENLKIYYLSHPISSIRRHPFGKDSEGAFCEELNEFIKEILYQENTCLFIPDTIDEKRIEKDKNGNFIPELLNSWHLPYFREQLFTNPSLNHINPLNPRNYDYQRAPYEVQSAISSLLDLLGKKIISSQINSRDRSLVEQSKNGVVVYRPFWGIEKPGGVEEEIKYNQLLRNSYNETERTTSVFSCCEDLGRMQIASSFDTLKVFVHSLNNETKLKLEKKFTQLIDNEETVSFFSNDEDDKEGRGRIRDSIEEILPSNYKFKEAIFKSSKTTLSEGEMLLDDEKLDLGWTELFKEKGKDPLLKYIEAEKKDFYKVYTEKKIDERRNDFIKSFLIIKGGSKDERT